MRCIELYKEQMELEKGNNADINLKLPGFLDAYYDLFTKFNLLELSPKRLEEIFREESLKIQKEHGEEVLAFALYLEKLIEKSAVKIQKKLKVKKLPDTILFIGDGTIDGHGLLIKDSAYGFFELTTLKEGLKQYHTDAFITHELLHPLHYQESPEFFSMNWKTTEEYYFKRMFSEGLATFFSGEICKLPPQVAFWFGFLEQEELNKWMDYCEERKAAIGTQLMNSIKAEKIDSGLYRQLFSIEGFEKLTEYRLAYYYGYEIVKRIQGIFSPQELLSMKYEEVRPYILKYFGFEEPKGRSGESKT